MWILSKHPPLQDGAGNPQFYLLGGRKYVIGRKDCDIVISGDCSISRSHATISLSKVNLADLEQPIEVVTIIDTSKVGVHINGSKITPNEETALSDGDLVSFGRQQLKYKLVHQSLVVVTSCINLAESKASLKSCLQKLGGFTSNHWSDKATHLVMEKVTFTLKVVCAIACGKPVVSVKYLEDLLDCCDKKTSLMLPDEKEYLPPISEQTLLHQEHRFNPNLDRKRLMVGKLFIILTPQQFKRIKEPIMFAGGDVILKDNKDVKFVKSTLSNQTIVLQVEKKDEKNCTAERMVWIKDVYATLKQHNLRPIRESEVGLAILYFTLEKYCNPTLSTAPALIGISHTQVFADSMSATQQSQINPEQSQLNESVTGVANESIEVTSKKVLGAANVYVTDKGKRINAASKRKHTDGSLNDARSEQRSISDFFKKPKLEESKNLQEPKKNNGNKNIINIENDDDEDDVFSFNFSKPCLPETLKTYDKDSVEVNENSQTVSVALNNESYAPNNSTPINVPTTEQVNIESNVLFTPLSKKIVPDTYMPSLITPLSKNRVPDTYMPSLITPSKKPETYLANTVTPSSKKVIPDSCPLSVLKSASKKPISGIHASSLNITRKIYDDDDDDDDDPFSFSVNARTRNTSNSPKGKDKKMEDMQSTRNENLKPSNIDSDSSKEENIENCKISNGSDESISRSLSSNEKQNSRFLKALSSSQLSESENEFISTEDSTLAPKDGVQEKTETNVGIDMSYLLNDDDDDMHVISKEYSLQKQKNHIVLNGFISTSDRRPMVNVMKEEDSDLIGIDRDLVKITFVSLVVNNIQRKKPDKTSNVPGSKSKNFKTFKKQYYAGRSRKVRMIGKHDLVLYETGNNERASLFDDIREKDEKEAAENQRIDKMFDVMPRH